MESKGNKILAGISKGIARADQREANYPAQQTRWNQRKLEPCNTGTQHRADKNHRCHKSKCQDA